MTKCAGITRAGTACQGTPQPDSPYCSQHDPNRAEVRKRNAAKGGKRGGRGRPVAELAALRDENATIRRGLLEGEIDPRVAAVAMQSLGVDTRLIDVTLRAKEQEELEGRMAELEAALEWQEERRAYRG